MIECGELPGGDPSLARDDDEESLVPLSYTNILISSRSCSSSSSCTKSESMVWADSANNGQTIVDNYNDHNPTYSTYTGTSYSTNGGATFTEIEPPPFSSGHGTNYGDPIVVFNAKLSEWFAGDLATGCGGFGLGLWTSTDGVHWTTGACAHNGTADDRESMWVDNEPSSGTYGRMYVSFDNGAVNAGALSVTHSDDGVTWTTPVVLFPNTTFTQRNVQLTGSPVGAARYEGTDSTVFVAAMDEGGGGFATRQNVIYKSLDGGNTWTSTTTGARFNPPGSLTCGYFAVVAPIWRHMGWGQPAVGPNGVVHYDYATAGTNGDVGDIYYVRSTDNGRTWSTPAKLNTDTDNSFHTQWMPSLTADKNGEVTASWYDRRAATTSCSVATDPGCSYERVGRQSSTNGVSFGSEITISSQIIPQPTQTDPSVVSCYAGDYDYDTALNGNYYDSWTDGRVAVSGVQVQNVEFANVTLGTPDFSISASPASQSIGAGSSTSYTVTVAPINGFTGTVALSVSGLPTGATGTFSPTSITGGSGTSTLNITTLSSTAVGTYTLTIKGISGTLNHTTTVTLIIAPLSCTAVPSCSLQGQGQGEVVTGQVAVTCNEATLLTASATICGNSCVTNSVAPPVPVTNLTAGDATQGSGGSCSLSWSWGGNNYSQNFNVP